MNAHETEDAVGIRVHLDGLNRQSADANLKWVGFMPNLIFILSRLLKNLCLIPVWVYIWVQKISPQFLAHFLIQFRLLPSKWMDLHFSISKSSRWRRKTAFSALSYNEREEKQVLKRQPDK
jgi:hypothetical protein